MPHLIAPEAAFDAANYELRGFALERRHAKDKTRQLRVDLQRDFAAGDWDGITRLAAEAMKLAV